MKSTLRAMIRSCWLPLAERAAKSYVAGPELADALRASRWLAAQGFASTICFWDELEDTPRQVTDAYLAALGALATEELNCYLSIKAPGLGFARELVAEVVARGLQTNTRIHFDALGPEVADQTLALIIDALPDSAQLGCTLPGRWRRSLRDAERAVELGLHVRVVKGQWEDPEQPTMDLRAGYLQVIDRLAGRARHVGVATHDPSLAREALRRLRARGTACELELLFGLPIEAAAQVAREEGVTARLYVPYGHAWLPYCLSQARKNPRILWWVLRDLLSGRALRVPEAEAEKRCTVNC